MASTDEAQAQSILYASRQYTISISFILLFAGVFGHAANIFVFIRLKVFRNSPSAFYLIMESIFDLFIMFISFTSRIAMNGFAVDLTQTSTPWCKLRPFFVQFLTLISLSIISFASIDQYLSTSHQPFLRQKSTIRLAKLLTIIASIVWFLHSIPVFFFYEIQSTYGCTIHNTIFLNYVAYSYYLILTGMLPIILSAFFSILAYKNVRRIVRRNMAVHRRKLDQQLTAMILLRVAVFVLTMLPYVLQRIYGLSTSESNNNAVFQAILELTGSIVLSFFYINYSVSFYLFLISSSRFRRQVKYAFVNKLWKVYGRQQQRQNQVGTVMPCTSSDLDSHSFH